MFYKLDSTRITLREYWWGTPNPLVIFGWIAKWLHIRLPGSVDDPNVDSLEPFRVSPAELPEEARAKFAPLHEELRACGFHSPVCYWIHDAVHQTDIYQAVYLHESGQALARIHYRVWGFPKPPKTYLFTTFVSCFTDGTCLVSSAGKPDMLAPPSCRVNRLVGAPASELWESHRRVLQEEQYTRTVAAIRDPDGLAEAVEAHHGVVRDFHVQRGVFVPMTAEEEEPAVAAARPPEGAEAEPSRNAVVLSEIAKLQQKSSGWLNALVILGVSVALFVGLGAARWSWEILLLLLPILFLHELGHYLAMRVFRYRNVRMFFIPLFGAAVSGQHYNVPGWKRAVVSLMGPLPGILLAAVAGIAGLILDVRLLVDAAILALILNGFNLLPILPLDGGWVMHAVLFSRHYLLDAAFRAGAIGVLMLGALLIGDWILFSLGLLMAFGLPTAFRLVRVVEMLKRRHVPAASPDDQSIPPETADAIIDEVRRSFPQSLSNKNLAQITVQAFEALNARPPGWLATFALAGVYGGSFLFALVFVCVFVIAQHVGLGEFVAAAASAPQNPVDPESIEVRRPADEPEIPVPEKTIVATFPRQARAEASFDQLAGQIPPQATLMRFGRSLLLAIPAEDDAAREQWLARLERETGDVHVSGELGESPLALAAIAPNEEAAVRIEQALRAYFAADPSMDLIPPWHPHLRITPEQERARQMYAKLTDASGPQEDPKMAQTREQIAQAYRTGDDERARELQEQMRKLWQRAEETHLEKLRRQTSDPAEREVIELYRDRPVLDFEVGPSADEQADENAVSPAPSGKVDGETVETSPHEAWEKLQQDYAEWSRRMGERLGRLPQEGDGAGPGRQRFSAIGGVTRTGLMVQVFLTFDRLVDGPPALVRWLCEQNCAGLKYEFTGKHLLRPGLIGPQASEPASAQGRQRGAGAATEAPED